MDTCDFFSIYDVALLSSFNWYCHLADNVSIIEVRHRENIKLWQGGKRGDYGIEVSFLEIYCRCVS